jgi:hypothetical protein
MNGFIIRKRAVKFVIVPFSFPYVLILANYKNESVIGLYTKRQCPIFHEGKTDDQRAAFQLFQLYYYCYY